MLALCGIVHNIKNYYLAPLLLILILWEFFHRNKNYKSWFFRKIGGKDGLNILPKVDSDLSYVFKIASSRTHCHMDTRIWRNLYLLSMPVLKKYSPWRHLLVNAASSFSGSKQPDNIERETVFYILQCNRL